MLLKKFLGFTLPSILSMWIFSLYSMVDGIFVAHGVGEYALAAVNLSMPYTIFVYSLGLLIAMGSSTIISTLLGEGDTDKARQIFNQNLIVLSVAGILLTTVTLLNLDRIAVLLGATAETFKYVKGYLGWISVFAVFFMLSYNMEIYIKTDGFPKLQMFGVLFSALVNLVLDYIFVMKLHLGVEGAAVATGISQLVSTVLFLCYFKFRGKNLRFQKFRFDFSIYRRIIPLGLADSITELSGGLVIFLFNHVILMQIGEDGLISYTVISYINTLAINCMAGIAQGNQPLVSFYRGAGQHDLCRKLLKYGLCSAAVVGTAFLALAELVPQFPIFIFLGSQATALTERSITALRLYGLSFALVGFNIVAAGFFTAIERPLFSVTISAARSFIVLAVCLFTLTYLFGETGIWISTAVSEAICLLLSAFFFWRYMTGDTKQKVPAKPLAEELT